MLPSRHIREVLCFATNSMQVEVVPRRALLRGVGEKTLGIYIWEAACQRAWRTAKWQVLQSV